MSDQLTIDNLSITANGQAIFEPVSFSVKAGEVIALVGPSGSGKSTLLKFLVQLNDPRLEHTGRYLFDGRDVNDYDPVTLRQAISYCVQTPSLFGQTVEDNLRFPYEIRNLEFDRSHALELLNQMKLSDAFLDRKINSLSGGEKQRVSLIRNVLFAPKVILLDEITSALDGETRKDIWEWLRVYHEETGVTVILVSHMEEEQLMTQRQIKLVKANNKGGN
ncbi:ABC transporter ATP-binding protein [Fundicoccus culcitae]|uniref:ATP-binding cassette domain-containing protein n=1 Tax=Fundicoccus culcitae TaxID=2969821 RepID=A0ABY5P5U3_9LACT|nr:ATP-binding cassette domain-containing protein [Fundicoccus culcitae]UUX33798.1 ATP-binding cassette domain-containing protein [Fundicoccus culcitae]